MQPTASSPVRSRSVTPALLLLITGLIVSVPLAVTIGPVDLAPGDVYAVIFDHLGIAGPSGLSPMQDAIVWELRLPRVMLAALVGGGLATVGALMQAVIRNPLADPYLLGISSGASVGAVSVMLLGVGGGAVALSGGAFLGAMLSFGAVLLLATGGRGYLVPSRTILAGVAIGYLASALTSLITITSADAQAIRSLMFWLLGTLAGARWTDMPLAAGAVALTIIAGLAHARALNAFVFGDDSAESLGIRVHRTRWILLSVMALATGTLVALSGSIGFVGLVLPHATRFLVGHDHRRLIPIAALAGAIFLIWVDALGRVLFAPSEVPVGVLTALIGVPAFGWLLWRRRFA